jgi:phosphoserine aminotransferase
VVWSSADSGFDHVPAVDRVRCDPDAAYLHYTSNNTVVGTQLRETPDCGSVPLVCDMSSDLLSRPLALDRFGLVYAGAQKNLGPAGVTVVIVRKDLLERSPDDLPDTLTYAKMAAKDSLLNTPPVFAIYTVGLVARWLLDRGGLAAAAERSEAKARALYRAIDESDGFYRGHARPASRSWMNVTFRLPDEALEARFVEEATAAELVGLKGHRSVGGIRASIYNAVDLASVERLIQFMAEFRTRHG